MLYILYNSNSKIGKNKRNIFKILFDAVKTFQDDNIRIKDIATTINKEESIKNINKQKDIIVIVGGDGTLTRLVDKFYKYIDLIPKVYAYKAGTGNDFIRNIIKSGYTYEHIKNKYFLINPFLENLPKVEINNETHIFLNGIGIGLDGFICKKVEEQRIKNGKQNFFRSSIQAFKEFKPYPKIEITVDGKTETLENVWLASIMNGKYYGKGMKIAPFADIKSNKLNLIVIDNITKFKLLFFFPTVYFGRHIKNKFVKSYVGNKISLKLYEKTYGQIDGEFQENITEATAYKDFKNKI
ncbi:diacylglycerol kinase family protein [Metamycoplasma salivarium]|uniref:diacylglycerol/lipid kinase family protein n=1 Tax=Metamycoplasma salivarium TaxID=2124 RepID=UPI0035BC272A